MTLRQFRTTVSLTGISFIGVLLMATESLAIGALVLACVLAGYVIGYLQCRIDEEWERHQQ